MNKILLALLLLVSISPTYGQVPKEGNMLYWSADRKLVAEDFLIKTGNQGRGGSFAQYHVEYNVHGFDFLTRDFNHRVRNGLIRSASMIDTTSDLALNLRYQQTLFDMAEVYTRRFRKALRENRGKIALGLQVVEEFNQRIMTDLSQRRLRYEMETKSGTVLERQLAWESMIKKELDELREFGL